MGRHPADFSAPSREDKPLRLLSWFYRKLKTRYPGAFLIAELHTALIVTALTLALLSFYYDGSTTEYLTMLAIVMVLTELTIWAALYRTFPRLRPIRRWIGGERDAESTTEAWAAAVGLPLDLIRADAILPLFMLLIPSCVAGVVVFDLSWPAFFPLFIASAISAGYVGMLHYLALETGMRPVLIDINSEVSPRTHANVSALPLRVRLMAALPLMNLITGLTVAALTSDGGGGQALGVDVLVAVGVATTVALELTVMLSRSILRPIADLQRATAEVRRGNFDISVPVTTGDELGELAASFNEMLAGLAERERIREAFGTYLDQEVAEYILSEEFPDEGVEMEVSILFLDVMDYTGFAASAEAKEVVARLNALFEVAVPIIARHGGHVDKFIGDGLMAVFGAPEPFEDHADRAVRAACELASAINSDEGPGLRIGMGVNTGEVIAGSIGGAGRLNFSVIGDPVNVAARVEAATRQLDNDVLISGATAERLSPGAVDLVDCGRHELKGLSEPVELHAPKMAVAVGAQGKREHDEPLAVSEDGQGAGQAASRGMAQL